MARARSTAGRRARKETARGHRRDAHRLIRSSHRAQGNSLTATLKENLGHKLSATSLALRWINWSYQRLTYKRLGELDAHHYRLLADLLDGKPLEDSDYPQRIRQKRQEIQVWMKRATRFGDAARIAYRLSPSARHAAPGK